MSNINLQQITTPFQYQRNAIGICKSFTYYPYTIHGKGHSLISLWTDNDDLVAQPIQIKTSFISKITNLQQDNDFMRIVMIDGENEKHIFAINKRLFCSNFTAIVHGTEYKPTEEDLVFVKRLGIVNEFLQAIYMNPRISLNIEKSEISDVEYWCQVVQS